MGTMDLVYSQGIEAVSTGADLTPPPGGTDPEAGAVGQITFTGNSLTLTDTLITSQTASNDVTNVAGSITANITLGLPGTGSITITDTDISATTSGDSDAGGMPIAYVDQGLDSLQVLNQRPDDLAEVGVQPGRLFEVAVEQLDERRLERHDVVAVVGDRVPRPHAERSSEAARFGARRRAPLLVQLPHQLRLLGQALRGELEPRQGIQSIETLRVGGRLALELLAQLVELGSAGAH